MGYSTWGRKESDTTERLKLNFIILEQGESGKAVHFWFFGLLLEGEIEMPKAGGPDGRLTVGAAARIQGWSWAASMGSGGQAWFRGGCKGEAVHTAGTRSKETVT